MAALMYSTYVNERSLNEYASQPDGWERFIAYLRELGVSKAFLEVWGDGTQTDADVLRTARDECEKAGIAASAVIFPSRQEDVITDGNSAKSEHGEIGGNSRWGGDLCYSKPIARKVLRDAVELSAKLFDELIIDDGLCIQCTCADCRRGRAGRTWEEYRRDLMLEVCREDIVAPCRAAKPDMRVILKFPQWYDRLHRFGYDTERQPELFDATWVGTETRDPDTPDFGYVPQYEGYFNMLWHTTAEPDAAGAWFDTYDCTDQLYVEQALMSVLGGARDILLFTDGEHTMRRGYMRALNEEKQNLQRIADHLEGQQPVGITVLRPHNPEPWEDNYVFDALGMLGFPLVPCTTLPETPPNALLLTAHSAHVPGLTEYVAATVEAGGMVFLTAALLTLLDEDEEFKRLAGYEGDGSAQRIPWPAATFHVGEETAEVHTPVEIRFDLCPSSAEVLATGEAVAYHRTVQIPVVTRRMHPSGGSVVVLNVRGVADTDFLIHENLNVPEPLSAFGLPPVLTECIQEEIARALGRAFSTGPGVSYHMYDGGDILLCNCTDDRVRAVPLGDDLPDDARFVLGQARIVEMHGKHSVFIRPRSYALISNRGQVFAPSEKSTMPRVTDASPAP